MKNACVIILSILFFSMTSTAQNTKQIIEKLSKDPKTDANAAKADVYIINSKKVISDTTVIPTPKVARRKKVKRSIDLKKFNT